MLQENKTRRRSPPDVLSTSVGGSLKNFYRPTLTHAILWLQHTYRTANSNSTSIIFLNGGPTPGTFLVNGSVCSLLSSIFVYILLPPFLMDAYPNICTPHLSHTQHVYIIYFLSHSYYCHQQYTTYKP